MRHFLAGEDLGQLLGAAGRVFGGNNAQPNAGLATQRLFQRRDRFRFVVFDADQRDLGCRMCCRICVPSMIWSACSCIRRSSAVM